MSETMSDSPGRERCLVCEGVILSNRYESLAPSDCLFGVCSAGGNHSLDEAEIIREQIAQRRLTARKALAEEGVRSPLTQEDEDEILAACSDAYRRGYEDGRRTDSAPSPPPDGARAVTAVLLRADAQLVTN
jgi:hypothetical protein